MDRETTRQEIRRRINCTDYLEKSKGGLYCCPFCGSGTREHKTGALKYYPDTNTVHCKACSRYGDVIDLYRQHTGTDYNTALQELAAQLGITIDAYNPLERPQSDFKAQEGNYTPKGEKTQEAANLTAYYKACKDRITDPEATAYLQSRGISLETAAAYWIGYDPQADPAQSKHPCKRIIIPTSAEHYIARSIEAGTPAAYKAMNPKGVKPAIFNSKVLHAQEVQAVFVTEGAFDALSILEAGAQAIALNSTANADALINLLSEKPTKATLILCLDNDDAGAKATEKIRAELQRLNIAYTTADICKGCKDPNEALQADKAAFIDNVKQALIRTAPKPDNTSGYIDTFMQQDISRFKDDIKTGFAELDKQSGGLYSGLYVLAAISSLGKTSFALQLADQLAASGKDVLFFSLEQSRLELISKSLARRTAQKDMKNAVTSLSIRKGYKSNVVREAIKEYKDEVKDRFSIIEGNFNCNISFIGDYIRQYVHRNNSRPVIFIDYLQILQPAKDNPRQSLKETVDNTITELKRISRELDLTVFIISSVNRANYLAPIDFESLKESGGIEYTADVIWGLQLAILSEDPIFDKQNGIKEKREKIKEAKAANPREIELVCLKNRYGIASFSCYFDYYPANDLFKEPARVEIEWGGTI